MNSNEVMKGINQNNPYFEVIIMDDKNYKYNIKYFIDNPLINTITNEIIKEIIFDCGSFGIFNNKIYKKYLNIYSQLSKLSESINVFNGIQSNNIISGTISYLEFVMDLVLTLLINHKERKNLFSKKVELFPNKCLGCGIDLDEYNPRQYCCKTYCPNDSITNY